MLEKERISSVELSVLVALFTIGTTILSIPASMTAKTKQDAWLPSLLGIIICGLLAYLYVSCAKSMGRETFIKYLERVYGKVVGKLIGLSYVYFGMVGTCAILYQFGGFSTNQMLVGTPIEVLIILMAVLVMLVSRAGLEVLARTGELLIPWFMFLFFALVILLIPQIDFERLSPLNEGKVPAYFSATLDYVATSGLPLVMLLMFFPSSINISNIKKWKWSFISGAVFGGLVVGIIVLLCILVLGASATARQIYPSYVLAKTVSVFDIIERIESVMAGMWVVSLFFKTSIYFYTSVIAFAEIFEVKNYRFLVFPLGILSIVFATVIYPNVAYMNMWDDKYWEPYAIIMGLLIPLTTLMVDKIKGRLKANASGNNQNEESLQSQ